MTTALAAAGFALLRGLLAGYGGAWFLPVLAREAVAGAAPLLPVAIAEALLVRAMPRYARAVRDVGGVVALAVLFALFGHAWVEPHTRLAEAADADALPVMLALAGAVCGVLAAVFGRVASEGAAVAVRIALAGWLIVGPDLYAGLDHVEAWRRLFAAALVVALFAATAIVLAIRARPTDRAAAGAFDDGARREASGVSGPPAAGRTGRGRSLDREEARRTTAAVVGMLGVTVVAAVLWPGPPRPRAGPSIVLVLVDTLRADALDRKTAAGAPLMPRLAEIARFGTRYTQAVSPSPWTLPSAVTLLSAMNPFRHRAGRMHGLTAVPGDASATWLGPALRDAGYQAAAFVNNPWLRPYYGLGRGYLRFRRYHGNASRGVDVALDWIDVHRARPSFVFLHLMDPHWPYRAPSGYGEPRRACDECDDLAVMQYRATSLETRAEVRRRYDAETAYVDAQIGRLWDALGASGALDDTWLVVTSDHGEEFWEHLRFLHGHSLYDELLRIPLVVVPPRADANARRGVSAGEQVRLEDVAATMAALAGVDTTKVTLDGRTLLDDAADAAPPPVQSARDAVAGRPLVAGYLALEGSRDWAVRALGSKLMHMAESPVALLYDLGADPAETMNVALSRPFFALMLAAVPAALGLQVAPTEEKSSRGDGPAEPPRVDRDVERELRALGYAD